MVNRSHTSLGEQINWLETWFVTTNVRKTDRWKWSRSFVSDFCVCCCGLSLQMLSFPVCAAQWKGYRPSSAVPLWVPIRPMSVAHWRDGEAAPTSEWTPNRGEDHIVWGMWTTERDGPPNFSTGPVDALVSQEDDVLTHVRNPRGVTKELISVSQVTLQVSTVASVSLAGPDLTVTRVGLLWCVRTSTHWALQSCKSSWTSWIWPRTQSTRTIWSPLSTGSESSDPTGPSHSSPTSPSTTSLCGSTTTQSETLC